MGSILDREPQVDDEAFVEILVFSFGMPSGGKGVRVGGRTPLGRERGS